MNYRFQSFSIYHGCIFIAFTESSRDSNFCLRHTLNSTTHSNNTVRVNCRYLLETLSTEKRNLN